MIRLQSGERLVAVLIRVQTAASVFESESAVSRRLSRGRVQSGGVSLAGSFTTLQSGGFLVTCTTSDFWKIRVRKTDSCIYLFQARVKGFLLNDRRC